MKEETKNKVEDLKRRTKETALNVWAWCKNNPKDAMMAGALLVGGCTKIAKTGERHLRLKEEKNLKDLYIYDMSFKHYYKMRRTPTTSEWLEIERRKRNGESLGWILNDMRLV